MAPIEATALMAGLCGNAILLLEHVWKYHRAGLSLKGLGGLAAVGLLVPWSLVILVVGGWLSRRWSRW